MLSVVVFVGLRGGRKEVRTVRAGSVDLEQIVKSTEVI